MILERFFGRLGAGIKAIPREKRPSMASLLVQYPDAPLYEVHTDNIYKALVLMLPGYDLDPSSGWQRVAAGADGARIADEMTGYVGQDRASLKAVHNEDGDVSAYILTSVPGGRVGFEGKRLNLDATHYQYTGEPEGGRGGA